MKLSNMTVFPSLRFGQTWLCTVPS